MTEMNKMKDDIFEHDKIDKNERVGENEGRKTENLMRKKDNSNHIDDWYARIPKYFFFNEISSPPPGPLPYPSKRLLTRKAEQKLHSMAGSLLVQRTGAQNKANWEIFQKVESELNNSNMKKDS